MTNRGTCELMEITLNACALTDALRTSRGSVVSSETLSSLDDTYSQLMMHLGGQTFHLLGKDHILTWKCFINDVSSEQAPFQNSKSLINTELIFLDYINETDSRYN